MSEHKPGKTLAERRAEDAFVKAQLIDHIGMLELDANLTSGAAKLVPKALEQAAQGDLALLKTLMRYSQQGNRRMQNAARIRAAAANKLPETK